jgi:hypothetical protein
MRESGSGKRFSPARVIECGESQVTAVEYVESALRGRYLQVSVAVHSVMHDRVRRFVNDTQGQHLLCGSGSDR